MLIGCASTPNHGTEWYRIKNRPDLTVVRDWLHQDFTALHPYPFTVLQSSQTFCDEHDIV